VRDLPLTYFDRLRRAVFPSDGERAGAEQALAALARGDARSAGGASRLAASDLAMFRGHPSGLSSRRAASRLGTPLWEVFPGHVALLDRDGLIISINRAWREFGLDHNGGATCGMGMNYLELCEGAAADGEPEAAAAAAVVRAALRGEFPAERVDYPCADVGQAGFYRLQALPLPGRHSGALVVHTDITADRQHEPHGQHGQHGQPRGLHDPLTGLPNRALLLERLEQVLAGGDPHSVAVLFVDVVGFTQIIGAHGRAVGDEVLAETAYRMKTAVRETDTVGRWGEHEFLAIAEQLGDARTAGDLAARIAAAVGSSVLATGLEVPVSAAIGIAYPDSRASARQLAAAAGSAVGHLDDSAAPERLDTSA
jgi:diguanylate cyclase (GGDEF)-like protein